MQAHVMVEESKRKFVPADMQVIYTAFDLALLTSAMRGNRMLKFE